MRALKLNKRNILIICVLIIVGWGMFSRYLASVDLYKRTEAAAVPNVTTIIAKTGATTEEIVLPANIQAWHEAPIFARTNGYIKRWVTDIGAHVKTGDLIAEIETPEVDAQMHQAEADLLTAKANNPLAQITVKRWVALLKTNSVSKQETDEKTGDAKAKEALMQAAAANYNRLQELESFKNLVAPFDGTITARNVDDGSLINAGSSTSTRELFHIAEVDRLRVYVQVPQTYAIALKSGFEASVHFTEHPEKSYAAKLLDTAGALDPVTRTLLLEFELDNKDGALLSGGYAELHMNTPLAQANIMLPVNVLIFRKAGLQVAAVKDNHVALKTITVARDFGNQVEVSSGIDVGDRIIINPSDSLAQGQQVNVITPVKGEPGKDKKS
jgi:RND family efflux transporter MFP subunit